MKKTLLTLLLACAVAFPAGDPVSFHIWKAGDIAAKGKELAKKLDSFKSANETVDTIGNRTFMVAHREGNGRAEWHERQADIIMIENGSATEVYGGEVVGGKTTAPGEIRGDSIKGGTETALGQGDVLHIPAKVAHMMKVAPGKTVTYFVVKVVE